MRTIDELLEQTRKELVSCIRSNFPDCAVEDVFIGLKKMTGQVKSRVQEDAKLAELKRQGTVLRMAESAHFECCVCRYGTCIMRVHFLEQ